jgi:hypothetical protein
VSRVRSRRGDAEPEWRGPLSRLGTLLDIGPAMRKVEIDGPDGRPLARWQGWSWTMRGAIANADRLRTDRQPRPPARRGRSR